MCVCAANARLLGQAASAASIMPGQEPQVPSAHRATNQSCCPLQVGYTYLEDPAYKLYKDHPDVQAFEVCRRL